MLFSVSPLRKFCFSFLGQLLGLLDDLFLVASATELGDYLPAASGSNGELDDGFGQHCNVLLRPVSVDDNNFFGFLLFLGNFSGSFSFLGIS